jgi:nucleoside-diphosphate-sugar epimerase
MHILIAGATGAAGRALIPLLIANGHTVTGTTRTEAKAGELRALGANAQIMDGLDAASVKAAIDATQPDVIVHQMTALTGIDMKNIDKAFALTNRLRTEGTEHLLEAAHGKLLVAQSFAGWPYERRGGPVKTEADPLDPEPPKGIRETHAAIRRLEQLTTEAGGIVLRYGGFYGPGTGMAPGGEQTRMIRKRQFPLVGTARASGPSCTPTTSPPRPWRRSSTAAPARSTTSSTTSPHPPRSGCPTWPTSSAPSPRARSRRGSPRSSRARPRWR